MLVLASIDQKLVSLPKTCGMALQVSPRSEQWIRFGDELTHSDPRNVSIVIDEIPLQRLKI